MEEHADATVKNVLSRYGGLNVTAQNAGTYLWRPIEKYGAWGIAIYDGNQSHWRISYRLRRPPRIKPELKHWIFLTIS
jgi:hypothetical protein